MCGSIFNKAVESAGKTCIKNPNICKPFVFDQFDEETKKQFKNGLELTKEYYGMSTKGLKERWDMKI